MAETRTKIRVHSYDVMPVSPAAKPRKQHTAVEIKFDRQRCKGCGQCVDVCPQENIEMSEKLNKKGHHYAQIIDEAKCTGCGLCYLMCPDLVIEIEKADG